jgi:hypothetical protein
MRCSSMRSFIGLARKRVSDAWDQGAVITANPRRTQSRAQARKVSMRTAEQAFDGGSQEEAGGGDAKFASQSKVESDSHGYANELSEGGLASEEVEDRHEWSFEDELERWSKGSEGDRSESRGDGLTSDEPQGDYEWTFENELEKLSNGSQGEDLRQ